MDPRYDSAIVPHARQATDAEVIASMAPVHARCEAVQQERAALRREAALRKQRSEARAFLARLEAQDALASAPKPEPTQAERAANARADRERAVAEFAAGRAERLQLEADTREFLFASGTCDFSPDAVRLYLERGWTRTR